MSKIFIIAGLSVVALLVSPVSAQTMIVHDDFTGFGFQTLEDVGGWGIDVNNTSPGGDFSQFTISDTGIPGIGEALQPITGCCPNADRFWDVPAGATKLHISWDMISTNGRGNQGFKVGDNPMQSADGGGTWINGFTSGGNWAANPTDGDGNNGDQHKYGAITNDEIVTMHVDVDATVQEKAIAFPTDARLYHKMRVALVRQAQRMGMHLRQSYRFVGKRALFKQGRYAHVR